MNEAEAKDEKVRLVQKIIILLSASRLNLRKWAENDFELPEKIPAESREVRLLGIMREAALSP